MEQSKHPSFIVWPRMQDQFGLGYSQIRFFRRDFLKTLKLVLAQYPDVQQAVKCDGRAVGCSSGLASLSFTVAGFTASGVAASMSSGARVASGSLVSKTF